MLDVDLNNTEPTHVERIKPQMTVDEYGNVIWTPSLLDYDASVFHRGKTVSNEEFNTLFLRQLYQGNYITDSLSELLNKHLNSVIRRQFEGTYELKQSYIKIFTSADWGEKQADGYYYITVPASEHGFEAISSDEAIESINIDTNLYILDTNENFYEVDQVEINAENTVTIYTDDNTVAGFLIVRSNERSYALTGSTIDVNQITNLAPVAKTGLYSDLIGAPDSKINKNASDILKILNGEYSVVNATNANNLTQDATFANGISFKDVFEEGSRVVKDATNAVNAKESKHTINADNAEIAQYASSDKTKGTIEERLTKLGFKEGSIILNDGYTATINKIYKQGTICRLCLKLRLTDTQKSRLATGSTLTIGRLPDDFMINNAQDEFIGNTINGSPRGYCIGRISAKGMIDTYIKLIFYMYGMLKIKSDGTIVIEGTTSYPVTNIDFEWVLDIYGIEGRCDTSYEIRV